MRNSQDINSHNNLSIAVRYGSVARRQAELRAQLEAQMRMIPVYSADGTMLEVPDIILRQLGYARKAMESQETIKTDKVDTLILKFVLDFCKFYAGKPIPTNPPVVDGRIPITPAEAEKLNLDELYLHEAILAAYEMDARQVFWRVVQKHADNIGSTYDDVRRMLNLRGMGTIDGFD